jgi:hypothetical protein
VADMLHCGYTDLVRLIAYALEVVCQIAHGLVSQKVSQWSLQPRIRSPCWHCLAVCRPHRRQ